jgi:stage II sporulation protein M
MAVFAIGMIFSLIFFNGREEKAMELFIELAKSLKDKGLDDLSAGPLSIKIFLNNTQIALMIMFLSLIPLLPIGLSICLLNGGTIGLVAFVFYLKTNNLLLLVLSILPHGIIEIPTIFYTASLGMLIWKKITLSVFNKKDDVKFSFLKALKCFLFIVVPLLMIAALIESFITPVFIGK